ncbi:MAG: permease-like cell division protein FtsX [Clostridia bacterium]|nr:permease-like cell division protein FtsX [Clostridia bacterium]
MRINNFNYYIKQASKSFRQNKLMSIASVTTTFAALFILGIFILLTLNVNHWADDFSRSCQIQVFISDELSAEEYDALGSEILKLESVEEIEKYTKTQIFEEMRIKLKEKANILDGLENDNPFRNSYKITLSDLNETKTVINALEKLDGIENITDFQESATLIVKVVDSIKAASLWLMAMLLIISAFIVSNSVKISVYARRREISIMKYVGATDWFIRWPFVIEGIIIGIYGAVICFLVMWIAYFSISKSISIPMLTLLPFSSVWLPLALSFVIVGVVIGSVGSIFSIRKHLKV